MTDQLYTYKELAEHWKVNIRTLRRWKKQRRVAATRIGKSIRFAESDILAAEKHIRANI